MGGPILVPQQCLAQVGNRHPQPTWLALSWLWFCQQVQQEIRTPVLGQGPGSLGCATARCHMHTGRGGWAWHLPTRPSAAAEQGKRAQQLLWVTPPPLVPPSQPPFPEEGTGDSALFTGTWDAGRVRAAACRGGTHTTVAGHMRLCGPHTCVQTRYAHWLFTRPGPLPPHTPTRIRNMATNSSCHRPTIRHQSRIPGMAEGVERAWGSNW